MMITNKLLIEEVEELKNLLSQGKAEIPSLGVPLARRSVSCVEYALRCN